MAFRLFVASGVACVNVMLSSVANDYPVDKTRAKMIAGVFHIQRRGHRDPAATLIGGLPGRFIEAGYDPVMAGRFAFWIVAGICVMLGRGAALGPEARRTRPGVQARTAFSPP